MVGEGLPESGVRQYLLPLGRGASVGGMLHVEAELLSDGHDGGPSLYESTILKATAREQYSYFLLSRHLGWQEVVGTIRPRGHKKRLAVLVRTARRVRGLGGS
ncbi:hypothetical protein GCM10010176_016850 [Nonomuraea spiralis]|nr:hypothetical protein GCM10010176_016850 [Nonomuraea spiralis]